MYTAATMLPDPGVRRLGRGEHMMIKKHQLVVVLAMSAVVGLAACNPAAPREEQQPVNSPGSTFTKEVSGTLKISGFNPSDEVGQSRADYAAGQLQGVKIELDKTNFDAQKFAAQVASGNVPDLLQMDRSVVATLADKELIIPLDECYSLHGVTPNQQYYPSTIADVTYDGKVYAVPQFFQPSALIANKRVLEKAGVSTDQLDTSKPDELVTLAKKLYAEKDGKPSVIGFDPDLPGSAYLWFTAFGGRTNDETGKPTLDDPNNAKAVNWMKQLMDAQGGYARIKSFKDSMDVFGDKNQYVKDQVAVQSWAQWYVNVLSNTKDDVSLAAVPIKTLEGKPLAMAGGTAFAVAAAAKNKSAACAWAVNATSQAAWVAAGEARAKTVQEKKSINTGLFTASPAADEAVRSQFVKPSGSSDFDQMIETYYSILPSNATRGASAVGQQIDQDLSNAVSVALTGEKKPEQALADAQASSLRAWDQSRAGRG
jgi:multiple sugar transport system substrate-binding protein